MVSFGRYCLDPAQFRLTRDGEAISLSPRPFDLLVALVARAGELVTREELLATVWKDMTVEPSSLNAAMSVLRQALGPGAADLIETVPGRGYRFLGQVDRAVAATGPAAPPPPAVPAVPDVPVTLQVAIVDDHAIVRVGVRTIVERSAGCRVVGEAGTVNEAGEMIAALRPDLLILDLMIGSDASLPFISRWRESAAGMRVIVLSMYEEDRYARQALAAGAHGYVMKGQMIEELQQAIEAVRTGGVWVSASLGRSIVKDFVDGGGLSA
jgi:DNA-binding response OmpR family regulator